MVDLNAVKLKLLDKYSGIMDQALRMQLLYYTFSEHELKIVEENLKKGQGARELKKTERKAQRLAANKELMDAVYKRRNRDVGAPQL